MRVPGVVFASRSLLPQVMEDEALRQVVNVAALPGIVEASYAMPDVHWGYGFPIGGVAATDVVAGGVVSPGGVGFDISCGVRLLASPLSADELAPKLGEVMDALDVGDPEGPGSGRACGTSKTTVISMWCCAKAFVPHSRPALAPSKTWPGAKTAGACVGLTRPR